MPPGKTNKEIIYDLEKYIFVSFNGEDGESRIGDSPGSNDGDEYLCSLFTSPPF